VVGAELGDRIVWGALELLPAGARLGDFGAGLIAAAEELEASSEIAASDVLAIRMLVSERGLDDCGAVLALEGDTGRKGTVIGLGILGQAFGASCSQVKGFGAVDAGAVPLLAGHRHERRRPASDRRLGRRCRALARSI
jgi:CelD/BcsL family acetyltransferase involved in cellulose biosynthesis